ncbi:MAG: SGNH/GDSL hydrolase family protein [Candidatus Microsaccharimonas sp.]
MVRLPQPGGDAGNWGEILNEYLLQSHEPDGALKNDSVGAPQLKAGAVTTAVIANGSITAAKIADASITPSKLQGLGDANGVASLDGSGRLPESQLPSRLAENNFDSSINSSSPQHVARQILSLTGKAETQISPVQPTVTFGASGATFTTVGGIRVSPKRLSPTLIDVQNDPHFEYVGVIPGRLVVSSSDMTYGEYLTGGSSQNARSRGRYRFVHTGQLFEAYFRMRGSSFNYRLYVDGLPTTTDMISVPITASNRYYIKVEFNTVATRTIAFEVHDPEFGGIIIGPTDSIRRPERGLLVAGMGDSHTMGANGVAWTDTWLRRSADALGLQFANVAIGGTGYLNGTTGNFRNRLSPDLFPLKPDVVILEGSWNDSSATEPQLQAEATYVFGQIRQALPNALLIAAGPWVTSHNLSTTLDAHDATLRAQAEASGWNGYISYRDPLGLKTSTAQWAASTAYALGDMVIRNGFVQLCVSSHTSTSTFDQTKWRSTAMVGGSGRVGATAGNGNADILVSNDGVHGTSLAHSVKGAFAAAAITRIARSIAAGANWAG